jgi:hypothetical protein
MTATLTPGRHVTILTATDARGIVLRVDGERARVMDAASEIPSWFPCADLQGRRGRPALVHTSGLCRHDLTHLVNTDPAFCQEAIRFLFGRQTDDEQGSACTRHDNDLGFRADHARKGTILSALAPDAWTGAEYDTARGILHRYTGTQLFDLAAEWVSFSGE